MKNVVKLLLCLILALPMVAYVANTLITSQRRTDNIEALVVQTGHTGQPSAPTSRLSRETLEVTPPPQDLISPAPRLQPLPNDEPADQDDSAGHQTPPPPGGDNSANGPGASDRDDRDRDTDEDPETSRRLGEGRGR